MKWVLFILAEYRWRDNNRGHQTSPTKVSLTGRLPQKLLSKSVLSCEIVQIQSVSSWFYKETEIKI